MRNAFKIFEFKRFHICDVSDWNSWD